MSIEMNHERTCLLSSLLPYAMAGKQNGKMAAALQEYQLLLIGTEQAINALKKGEFDQFDALVGENMCQIRAIKIAILAPSLLETVQSLRTSVATVKQKVDVVSESIAKNPRGTLADLFKKDSLDIALTSNEFFLVQTYLLTMIRVSKPSKVETPLLTNSVTAPKNLQKIVSVSSGFADSLVKLMRANISSDSVEFVRACAQTLGGSQLARFADQELVWRT